jgi:hypothetical protein
MYKYTIITIISNPMRVKDKQLIPSYFGLADGSEFSLPELTRITKAKLKSMKLDSAVYSTCIDIYDQSASGKGNFLQNKGLLTDQEFNIILKDFGEVSGAAYVLKAESSRYKAVKFPTGNEKLIDYYMVTKDGLDEKYSAKAGEGGKPSIVSLMPIIETMVANRVLGDKYKQATWALSYLGKQQPNALYLGPLQAAEYLNLPGYKELLTLLKDKKLNTGYITGIPTEKQLESAVENAGGYDLFRGITKDYYEASGYNNTIDIGTTKRILDKAYTRKRYGLLHYPITAELIKWLNIDKNYAKDILNKAANTLTINQIYLDKSGINLKYTVKTFSDGEFIFQSPSSTPYPVNNRIGFKMKKTPTAKNTLK